MAITAARFGINEGTMEEVKKYSVMGFGGFAGFGISEFTGEFLTKYAGWTGAKKTAVKIGFRLLFWIIFFGLSMYAPPGLVTLLLAGAGVGAFSGIFLDLFEAVQPGGVKGAAEAAVLSLKGKKVGGLAEQLVYSPPIEQIPVEQAPIYAQPQSVWE